ncbi:hypothetical protein ACHAWT_003988 [Skeletonema menzelii]
MSFKRTGEVIDLAGSSSEDDETNNNNITTNSNHHPTNNHHHRRSSPRLARKRRRISQQRQQHVDSDDEIHYNGMATISRGSSADNNNNNNNNNSFLLDNDDDDDEEEAMNVNEAIARGLMRPCRRGRRQQQQQHNTPRRSHGEVIDLQSPSSLPSSLPVATAATAAIATGSYSSVARGRNTTTATTNNNSNNNNYTRGGRRSETNLVNSTTWTCRRCTFDNSSLREQCGVCGVRAPHLSAAAPAAAAAARRSYYPWSNNDSEEDSSSSDDEGNSVPYYTMARRLGIGMSLSALAAASGQPLTHPNLFGMNIDQMNYQQLLETLGDGSEHRNTGASASTISSLPVNQLTNPLEELPEVQRTCNICLEDFERGERRKCLPCLHGFHEKCIDQWLSLNGVCPVCKTPVSD